MFTQPQLSCVVSEGTVLTHHKKRKLDHHHYTSSDVVSSTTSTYESSNSSASANGGAINYRRQNAHLKSSPSSNNNSSTANNNQQNFIRASTIKLLDSYTRCGQKVRITIKISSAQQKFCVDLFLLTSSFSMFTRVCCF